MLHFIKIRAVGANGRTDMRKLMVALGNFANGRKNEVYCESKKIGQLTRMGVRQGETREELHLDPKERMPHQGTLSR